MFDNLSDRLRLVFNKLSGKGKLTEEDVDIALREVRQALLEADVNYKVTKEFMARVRERAIGAEVLQSLTPAQQVIKIVNEELIHLLGDGEAKLQFANTPPTVIMMVGLQGSGKTTTTAKLALLLRKQGHRPLLVAADTYRPAAVDQLETLGKQLGIPVYSEGTKANPVDIAAHALKRAHEVAHTVVILDTAGRLHINEEMMGELSRMKERISPNEILLVADAMTGQDAVRAAGEFNQKLGLTGLILTKLDGDARGGAALSIRSVTGVPVKYVGVGEKADALETFHPDRLASRILGMGDMLTLIEKAQVEFDEKRAKEMEKKVRSATFNLEDFLEQLQQVKKMGPLDQILEMIPGLGSAMRAQKATVSDNELKRIEAIIRSMTPLERTSPDIIKGSRRRRIADGSGTSVQDVNMLLNQFKQMQNLMRKMSRGRIPKNIAGMMNPF
ncbi:MAG: signal recognition particle protein [Chloroflexi bacterium]|nr:signal recognition particle protein [Chloroflexota bacterium]